MPTHRLMGVVGPSGFFMWNPSAAVSREPSVPAFGLHQRLTSNVVLQQWRASLRHIALRATSYTAWCCAKYRRKFGRRSGWPSSRWRRRPARSRSGLPIRQRRRLRLSTDVPHVQHGVLLGHVIRYVLPALPGHFPEVGRVDVGGVHRWRRGRPPDPSPSRPQTPLGRSFPSRASLSRRCDGPLRARQSSH